MTRYLAVVEGALQDELTGVLSEPPPECECSLCDLPWGRPHEAVAWRLIWDFILSPAAVRGIVSMLLCEHCFGDWIGNPDDFGGDPVGSYPV